MLILIKKEVESENKYSIIIDVMDKFFEIIIRDVPPQEVAHIVGRRVKGYRL